VAKNLPPNKSLPLCNLTVSLNGVVIETVEGSASTSASSPLVQNSYWPIDTISYGVQDLVYTRVFAMIIVKENLKDNPFEVHAFVCDSRTMARKLTYSLAASFQDYSRRVKEAEDGNNNIDQITSIKKKFAIDLRSPEEQRQDVPQETEA
jgi:hypothetical protein